MDFFNEWIVKKKKSAQDVMTIIIVVMAALFVIHFILLQLASGVVLYLVPIEVAVVAFVAYVVISSLNVEFEYSVTNGDLDIEKIVAKRKRKKVASVKLRSIEYFAKLNDETIKVAESPDVRQVIDACSDIDSPNVYFVIYHNGSNKVCLLFEPTTEMVEHFSNYVPRSLNHTL